METLRIDRYWSARFGLEPHALDQPGVQVVPPTRPRKDSLAYVFVRGSTAVVSVGTGLVDATRERVGSLRPDALLLDSTLWAIFERPIHHLVGPLYQGYAEPADFRPRPTESVRALQPEQREAVAHLATACDAEQPESTLTPMWREVLQRFATACEPSEWEHSGIDRADSALFGYFVGADLAAVAHYSLWPDDAASIGVLTHPAHRNRGYGKAVVSAAMGDAFTHGHWVLYQTMAANDPSVALATALGCQDYARTIGVHFEDV